MMGPGGLGSTFSHASARRSSPSVTLGWKLFHTSLLPRHADCIVSPLISIRAQWIQSKKLMSVRNPVRVSFTVGWRRERVSG